MHPGFPNFHDRLKAGHARNDETTLELADEDV